MKNRPLSEFQAETGIVFQSQELLREAFIHSSFANEALPEDEVRSDNERLEFLGDAVLEFVVSKFLFDRYPDLREGELTRLRAALVRRETLARLANRRHLGEFLVLGHGEEESGGRNRPATLCATYEAVVGALFLDQGLHAVEEFVMPELVTELEYVRRRALGKDSKSRLQEWSQKEFGVAPRYHVVDTTGPDHAMRFVIEVTILGIRCGVGEGTSKQEASQAAATHGLISLGQLSSTTTASDEYAANWPVSDNLLDLLYDLAAEN